MQLIPQRVPRKSTLYFLTEMSFVTSLRKYAIHSFAVKVRAMAADQILSSSYFKYSDERQLIDEDEDEDIWLEDVDDDCAELSVKHVHFVTDASLSSWNDQDAAAYHSSTSLGFVYWNNVIKIHYQNTQYS